MKLAKDRLVIVSGFGAFRDYIHDDDNPSTPLAWQLASELMGRGIRCECIAPVAVSWGEVERVIAAAVARHHAASITWIAFGAGRDFAIETQATNRRTIDQPDASGRFAGKDVPLLNDESAARDAIEVMMHCAETHLAMQSSLAARGFAVRLSTDAGGYICNSAAYCLFKWQRAGMIDSPMFFHTPEVLAAAERGDFACALAHTLVVGDGGAPA